MKSENTIEEKLGVLIPREAFAQAFYEDYYERNIVENGIPLKEGLIELIDFLEEHDIKRAVATSTKTDLALKKLELVGIIDRFEIIVGGDQVAQGKPAPDPYLKAAEMIGIHVDHCLALEDSDNGAMSASNAGIKVIVVPDIKPPSHNTKNIALHILPSLFEVREYIAKNIKP